VTTPSGDWNPRHESGATPASLPRRSEVAPSDVDSIGITLSRYAWAVDHIDRATLADVFTDDAVLVLACRGLAVRPPIHGGGEIADYFIASRREHGYFERHHITNVVASPRGEGRASVTAYCLVTKVAESGHVVNITSADYTIEMARADDGAWLISTETISLDAPVPAM
jgi:ketosteroid isomerase-like protein